MEQNLEQQVWQRVRGGGEPPSLQALAAAEHLAAGRYWMLARQMQGPSKEQLRQLYQRARCHERYLNGMNLLMHGQPLSVAPAPSETGRPAVILSKCYAEGLKAAAEYGRRASDGEYGAVFARMAGEKQADCAVILEILGRSGGI